MCSSQAQWKSNLKAVSHLVLLPEGNRQRIAAFSLNPVTSNNTFIFQATQTMLHPEHWWRFLPLPLTAPVSCSKLWPPQPKTWAAAATPWTEIILKDSSKSLPLWRVIRGSHVPACSCQSPPELRMHNLKVQAISEKRNWKEKLNVIKKKKQTTKPTTKHRQVFLQFHIWIIFTHFFCF